MASPLVDYCEQVSPLLLESMQPEMRNFYPAKRRQESWLAGAEKAALFWLAQHTPSWINSDHLTMLGFIAQLLAGAAYAWSRWNKYALLAVVIALALNWLGDSLDGSLARYRQRQRPRYGFYVDHMVDSFGALGLMGGLAVSGYMHPYIALGLLIAFLLLSIQSYLATYTLGEFRLSFWKFGPTELRILLSAGNVALFVHGPYAHVAGRVLRLFDVGGAIGILGMATMVIAATAQNIHRLYNAERIR
jgi:phosphatidylglycerophosphate synthase